MAIQRIVVATDGSATAQAAVAWAAELAAPLGAAVVVISVIDYVHLYPSAMYFPADDTEMRERLGADLSGAWSEPMRHAGIKFRTLVREGSPGAVIVETAAAEKADLIIMGSRGHGRLQRVRAWQRRPPCDPSRSDSGCHRATLCRGGRAVGRCGDECHGSLTLATTEDRRGNWPTTVEAQVTSWCGGGGPLFVGGDRPPVRGWL